MTSEYHSEMYHSGRNYNQDELNLTLGKLLEVKETMIANQSNNKYTFTQWRGKRIESIRQLDQVIKNLEDQQSNCDSVKLVAETVSAISDAVSVFGAILNALEITDVKTSGNIIKSGRAISEIGTVVSQGTNFIKGFMESLEAKRAKSILEEDIELTDSLKKYLTPSQEFSRLVNEIVDFNTFVCIAQNFKKIEHKPRKRQRSRGKNKCRQVALPSDVETLIEFLPISHYGKKDARQFLLTLYQSVDGWNMLEELTGFEENNPFAFKVLKFASNPDNFSGRLPIQALNRCARESSLCMEVHTTKDVYGQGILSASRCAKKFLNMIDTAESISNQQPSDLIMKLKKLSSAMQQELDNFNEVYY